MSSMARRSPWLQAVNFNRSGSRTLRPPGVVKSPPMEPTPSRSTPVFLSDPLLKTFRQPIDSFISSLPHYLNKRLLRLFKHECNFSDLSFREFCQTSKTNVYHRFGFLIVKPTQTTQAIDSFISSLPHLRLLASHLRRLSYAPPTPVIHPTTAASPDALAVPISSSPAQLVILAPLSGLSFTNHNIPSRTGLLKLASCFLLASNRRLIIL
ncbi:hypothetical protein LXL04_023894 [Taraxacum kok-saghyz]